MLLDELGYDEKTVGTALNQEFVRAKDRAGRGFAKATPSRS
jgi:sulfur carrier protein